MAVSVSRDLTVQVLEDVNAVKLTDRQQALRAAIQKGEPKCLGVSQVMLGLMILSYSLPLHFTELTYVISFGVPWWTGLMFITAGVVAIILDKNCTMKLLWACLIVSVISAVLSVAAVTIYSVDLNKYKETCETMDEECDHKYYATKLSRGIKSSLLIFTLAQTAISLVICFLLFRQRHFSEHYVAINQASPPSPSLPTLTSNDQHLEEK
ncbi:transmembrane protein 176 isoform X1 [Kryptolebias marmoratus]|uniref:Membrane-spanning 4-domains subfamily A member 15-like n=1 Tax=Kryptolebias marmoratus TaxID=37003 RepID=A0A3Q3BP24_KRYMA|nr:transmembrane protein 176 isoform X1 [Kryptolebias marmoratus]XP_017297128.1 transmembrane protein 176 isoform X1 [Kryptolebias marmoratus]XP_017297129.1 transmembrane protein 176 isoform X1 [Kryptolebias marmoratus]